MKTGLLFILIIACAITIVLPAHASCVVSPDWPEGPCYDIGAISLEEKQNDWSFYYDHKGEPWMEQKKYEMINAIQTNSLSEWIELTNDTDANYNVHFYYYLLGQAPNTDGEYLFVCNMYEDVLKYEEILKDDLVLQSFLEKFPLAVSSLGGIDESRPPQTSIFYEYDEQNMRASLLIRAFEGDDQEPCLDPIMYTITYHNDSTDVKIRNFDTDTDEILEFLDSLYFTLPPLKQIKSGIALFDVQCNEGKSIVYKYDRMRAACVNDETETELINRGWALMRLGFPEYTRADFSSSLCGNYDGKWHPEYEGCRGNISDLQCSLMGGEFVDGLKICYGEICPENKTYTLCVTNSNEYDSAIPQNDMWCWTEWYLEKTAINESELVPSIQKTIAEFGPYVDVSEREITIYHNEEETVISVAGVWTKDQIQHEKLTSVVENYADDSKIMYDGIISCR